MAYEHLLSPIRIGSLELKNRMIVSAAVTRLSNPDNTISEAFIRYQEDKARGGWGLIITEDLPIMKGHETYPCLPAIWDDSFIPGHMQLTSRIHAAGGKICAQLYHPGRDAKKAVGGLDPVAPSAVRCLLGFAPVELTRDGIREIVKAFGAAALRAKQSGYDAVEIHGAHGYLIHQFLSSRFNKRTDEYGGSLPNKNRFLLEVIAEIRSQVSDDFPLLLRMNGNDYIDNGVTPVEAAYTARAAEAAGVNAIHCSQGSQDSFFAIIPPAAAGRAPYVQNAANIKKAVSIPVITVGRITDPGLADSIIASGTADCCTMFRASVADPELPKKIMEGREEEINFCVGCMQGCKGEMTRGPHLTCLVRPMTGHAHELDISPAAQKKDIAVIGGGISGCEAAIFAAQRGHRVTIYEKTGELGGRWIAASIPPGKSEYTSFLGWQRVMLEKYNVSVKLNTEATPELMQKLAPDEIILASGARDLIPPISGADMPHVVKAVDVLRERASYGQNIVVIGGGLVGAETADYLSEYSARKVSIVEMMPEIVRDGEPVPTYYLLKNFKKNHVDVYTSAAVKEIRSDCVIFEQNGAIHELKADTVVMAAGLRPNAEYTEAIKATGIPVVVVGDAASGKNGLKNIREGFMAGLSI